MALVINPAGKKVEIPDDQLKLALERGYKLDEAATAAAEQPVRTFAERALGTLTFGVSDEFLAGGLGAPYKDFRGQLKSGDVTLDPDLGAGALDQSGQLKERVEANPKAAFLGSLGGAVANPASRISAGAATVKGAFGLGLVEGGLFGLGSAVTADALGDQQALTEQLAARVGAAALTGGVTAGAVQSAVNAGTRALQSVEGSELPKRLQDFAAKAGAVIRKSEITDDDALKAAGLEWTDVDRWAKANGLFNRSTSPDAMRQQLTAALEKARADAGGALLDLEAVAKPEATAVIRKALSASAEAGAASPRAAGAARGYAKRLARDNDLEPIAPRADTVVSPELSWRRLAEDIAVYDSAPRTRALADKLRNELVQQAFKVDRDLAERLESGLQGERIANFLQRELTPGLGPDFGNAAAAALPAAVLGGPLAAVKAGGAVLVGQAVRKRAPMVAARALDALADSSTLKPLAESFLVQLKARLNTAPELLGPFRGVLESAAAEGAASALATHMQLAESELGDQYLSSMGMVREGPEDVQPTAQKLQALAAMQKVQTSFEERLSGSIKALDRDREELVASEREFWQVYESVQKMREQPAVDDRLGLFPDIQMGITAKLAEAAEYVQTRAPKPPDEHLPPALQRDWEPTPQERIDYLRMTKAAFQPLDAIEDVMYGQPAQKSLETLSALYPRLLEQAVLKMFERLNEDRPLTQKERQRMAPFIGAEAVGLSPQQEMALAAVHQKSAQPEQGPRVDGRQAVNQNQNYETQSQRIEARRGAK